MKLILFEIKKTCINPLILVFLILLIGVNIAKVYEYYKINSDLAYPSMATYRTLMWDYHEMLSGELSQKKIDLVIQNFSHMQNDYKNHTFDKEYNSEYQTGYFIQDYLIFKKEFYDEMMRNYNYKSYAETIVSDASENTAFYQRYGNIYKVNENLLIANLFSDRYINTFYRTEGYGAFFDYEFSSLMILCMIVIGAIPLFMKESETGMHELNITTKNGNFKLSFAKIGAFFIYSFLICLIFFITDFIAFNIIYGLTNVNAPLYSIKSFIATPFDVTILEGISISFLSKFSGVLSISGFFILFSVLMKNQIITYVISISSIIALFFLDRYIPLSPMNLIINSKLLSEFRSINLFGFAVLELCAGIVIYILIYMVCSLLSVLIYGRRKEKILDADKI